MLSPRIASNRSGRAAVMLPAGWAVVLVLAVGVAACGDNDPPRQHNAAASLTSIGPVTYERPSVLVEYTLRDSEGDDQSIYVGVCEGEELPDERCPSPVEGANSDGRTSLPTVPKGRDVTHRFAWNVGCGRVDSGSCSATDLAQSYVFRIRLQGTEQSAVTGTFSLGETFGLDEVPNCDESAGPIPEPCPPNDDT